MPLSRRQVLSSGVVAWVDGVAARRGHSATNSPGARRRRLDCGLFGQFNAALAGTDYGLADAIYPRRVLKIAVSAAALAPQIDRNDWSESGDVWWLFLEEMASARG